MIKTVIFDMGGVVITLDENEAGKRFVEVPRDTRNPVGKRVDHHPSLNTT